MSFLSDLFNGISEGAQNQVNTMIGIGLRKNWYWIALPIVIIVVCTVLAVKVRDKYRRK